ncbi:MAG: hypothetical protein PHD04_00845 [Candidatus Pacebacteria bacterium]|nr:hypothetical protein [Candidatus Paceibacterota bacterium]
MAFAAAAIPYVMAGTAALSAYGMYRQGQAAEDASEYNARISENDALAAKEKAEYDAETSAREFKRLMGRQKALYAKAGVDITEGSPLLMMAYQAEEAERDRQAILFGGKTASQSALDKARLFRLEGSNAATAGNISAGSTFLTGLVESGKAKYNYKNPSGTYY